MKRIRPFVIVGTLLLTSLAVCIWLAGNGTARGETTDVKEGKVLGIAEFQMIVDEVSTVPPEVGADVLIRVAESHRLPRRTTKPDLLVRAFDLAAQAEEPVKRTAMAGSLVDTRSGYLALGFRLNLDRLSLQSRAVLDMLPLNAAKARELLSRIQFPELAPLGCEEPLAYDLSDFYKMLTQVVSNGFTAAERRKGLDAELLLPYIRTLRSHAQVIPVAKMLIEAKLSTEDLEDETRRFASALSELNGDERSFAAVAYSSPPAYSVSAWVIHLAETLDKKGVSSFVLIKALRQYLVTNFKGVLCGSSRGAQEGLLPEAVKYYNQQLEKNLAASQVFPISATDLKGVRIGPKESTEALWKSVGAKELLTSIKKLRFGNGKDPVSTDRTTSTWSAEQIDFFAKLEAWQPDNEVEPDWFDEKSILYEGLIGLLPQGPERSKVIDSFVGFLTLYSGRSTTRIEWLWHSRGLLSQSRAPREHDEVIRACLNSRDQVLHLWAQLKVWEQRQG